MKILKVKTAVCDFITSRTANLNERISQHRQYLFAGLGILIASSLLSFLFFRERPLSLTVSLAKVEFKDELTQTYPTKSEIKPIKSWDMLAVRAGQVDRLFGQTGDLVKKDQILAVIGESENKLALENALKEFKDESNKFTKSKREHQKGSRDFEAGKIAFDKKKTDLESAHKKFQESLIRAPADGYLFLGATHLGDLVKERTRIAQVEDLSKYLLPIRVPASTSKEIPPQSKILVLLPTMPEGQKPIEVLSEVHYGKANPEAAGSDVDLEVVVPAGELLAKWLHQPVNLVISMRNLKQVALVDDKAVFAKDGESQILLLSSFGTLHWQRVTNAPRREKKILVKGADPKTFRVVLPEHPEILNKAITFNVKPTVRNGG